MTRVVLMGDSVTAGQHIDPPHRWTDIVTARLAADCPGTEVHVRGVSGDTTRLGLERFPRDVQAIKPDVLVIQFGLNDCNRWDTDHGLPRVSLDAYRANLREMVARGLRFGAKRVILATAYPTRRRGLEWGGDRIRYNEALRSEVAWSDGVVVLCDVAGFGQWGDGLPTFLLADLLHLSIAGHTLYADLIYPPILAAVRSIGAP